jgi:hypothetical protein
MGTSCCTVVTVETTYLVALVMAFLVIGAAAVYAVVRLLSAQR